MKYIQVTATFVLFGLAACSLTSLNDELEWLSWKLKYNKKYKSLEEESVHKAIWLKNKAYVEDHYRKADVKFKVGLNKFADQEVPKRPTLQYTDASKTHKDVKTGNLLYQPASFDWRTKGAVSPVRNQGMLGDAQAIVAAECVESYHFIQDKQLLRLSESEAHDCCSPSTPPANPLLNTHIFDCIHNITGLCSEADYPKPEGKCMSKSCTAAAQIDGGKQVSSGDENMLLEAVLKTPVFAAIDAGQQSFQLYVGGVYSDKNCNSKSLDHVVQIVGYGSLKGIPYWIIKNSWGTNWGMKGYMLMERNKNMCGIATCALYPD